MRKALDQFIRRRAMDVCEYCRLPQLATRLTFPIDHIVARQHHGPTREDNLALCCLHCNSHKGTNIAARDPQTGALVPLFNPRTDRWADHFEWRGPVIVGLTPIGRATIDILKMNSDHQLNRRSFLIAEGVMRVDSGAGEGA